ncbi:MAG TPA: MFS transporter [Pyrinomonadaceae bacterium]|nr:MFS transporter [Pyrinomonadaceae bacterium]
MQVAARADLTSEASHNNLLVIFGGLLLVMLLAALDSTIVATALPTIVGEFGGLAHISWVVTAYLLAQTIVTPIYGKLGDLYGRKRVLQIAIVIFLVGSALCGLSQSMSHLIIFPAAWPLRMRSCFASSVARWAQRCLAPCSQRNSTPTCSDFCPALAHSI